MQKQALVVDDSRVARLTLSRLLTPYDIDIVQIASGEEALSYLRSNEIIPDIIFMDVTMQGIDGIETTKRIKENVSLSNIPVVMCSGHDTQDEQNKAFAVGALASLTKPPKQDALAGIMAQLDSEPKIEAEVGVLVIEPPMLLTPSAISPEINITPPSIELDKTIINQLEQDWLPSIQKSIDERVGNITRRVATETAKGVVFQQSITSPQSTSNGNDLKLKITSIIKSDVLPDFEKTIQEQVENISRRIILESMNTSVVNHVSSVLPSLREQAKRDTVEIAQQVANQSVRETVESVSRQVIPELMDASIASHMTGILSSLKEQLKEQTKQAAIGVAQQTAEKMVDETAESAVKFAIDDFDLSAKAMEALEQQGTVWLTQQEQHLSLAVSQQAEQNVSPLVSQYLDVNLVDKIATYIAEIEANTPKEESSEIRGINLQLESLTQKVLFLKEVVIVLSVVIVGMVAVSLLLNAGIL